MGEIPCGSDLAEDGTTLVPNEQEQAIIRDIRPMRAQGMNLEQIVANLTKRGTPKKKGRSRRWSYQSVGGILRRTG